MIKKVTDSKTRKQVVTYVCDNCIKEMPGAAIQVYYPYGHPCDSIDGPSHFCSDSCVIKWQKKEIEKFGEWKSKDDSHDHKILSSAEWRRVQKNPPKAKRATRSRKGTQRKKQEPKSEE